MDNELISVIQVASELGKQKQHIFKVLDRLGSVRTLEKSTAARGQRIAYVKTEDYERVEEHFGGVNSESSEIIVDSDAWGVFLSNTIRA